MLVVVVDSHINVLIVLATEETTVTQQVSHGPIKSQSCSWAQRGTEVNGSHHDDSPLLKPTEGSKSRQNPWQVQPTEYVHRKVIGVKMMSLGMNCGFYLSVPCICIWSYICRVYVYVVVVYVVVVVSQRIGCQPEKKLLHTVANPAPRGLLNRGKKKKSMYVYVLCIFIN